MTIMNIIIVINGIILVSTMTTALKVADKDISNKKEI